MLSAKPWKADAALRLLLGMFVCMYAASLADSVRQFVATPTGVQPPMFYGVSAASFCFLAATLVVLGRPWRLETFMRQMVALLICFYAGFFGGAWAQKIAGLPKASVGQIIIGTLGFHALGLLLIWRFLREHRVGWQDAFGFNHRLLQALFLGLILGLLILPVGRGLQQLSYFVITHTPQIHMEAKEQETVRVLRATVSWIPRAVIGVLAIFLAPVTEEMLFRGILYPLIKRAGYPKLALWGVSLLFAAVHVNFVTFVPLLALALALTLLYEFTDNLLAPVTTHVLFNALNFVELCKELAI